MGLYAQSRSINLTNEVINQCSMYTSGISQQVSDPIVQFTFNTSGTVVYDATASISGVCTGSITWDAGKIGSCVSFPGSVGYVNCGDTTEPGSEATLTVWIKPTVSLTDNNKTVSFLSKASQYKLFYYSTTPIIACDFYSGGTRNFMDTSLATAGVTGTDWYHLAAVYEPPNFKLYVNGSLKNTNNKGTYVIANTANSFLIGADTTTSDAFYGKIDDVRIYDHALSLADIQALYNSGNGTETENPETMSGLNYYLTSNNSDYQQIPSTGSGRVIFASAGSDLKWRITCGSNAQASVGYVQLDW